MWNYESLDLLLIYFCTCHLGALPGEVSNEKNDVKFSCRLLKYLSEKWYKRHTGLMACGSWYIVSACNLFYFVKGEVKFQVILQRIDTKFEAIVGFCPQLAY
jgi:hypothetical protein